MRWTRAAGIVIGVLVPLAVAASCAPATGTASTGGQVGSVPVEPGAPGVAGSTPSTTEGPLPQGPFAVATSQRTLVDTTRPTEAGAATPARPERTLETWIFQPEGPGPFPLIVFSHGLSGHPDKFTKLLTAWAKAGFLVAAPAFPLTNDKVPSSSANWTGLAHQPADVSFVITQMLAANQDPTDALHGLIRPDRVGVGGLSLGGATTYGVTFNDCCRDDRIKAAEVLSGAQLAVGGENHLDGHVPLLIMHGDADLSLPYAMEVDGYAKATGPVWFVTLLGGSHAPPFEDSPSPHDAVDEQITTTFWQGTLGGDPAALARLDTEGVVPGLTTLQKK